MDNNEANIPQVLDSTRRKFATRTNYAEPVLHTSRFFRHPTIELTCRCFIFLTTKHLTPELSGRAFNASSIQVSRMKAALFALRSNELLDGGDRLSVPLDYPQPSAEHVARYQQCKEEGVIPKRRNIVELYRCNDA